MNVPIICPNCQQDLGCGCLKRVAEDGTKACVYCVENVNAQIKGAELIGEARRILANTTPR